MELCEAINHAREVAIQFNECSRCRKEHNQLADWLEELVKFKDILGDTYDLDRLRELVKADRDGRCVVLPCKKWLKATKYPAIVPHDKLFAREYVGEWVTESEFRAHRMAQRLKERYSK